MPSALIGSVCAFFGLFKEREYSPLPPAPPEKAFRLIYTWFLYYIDQKDMNLRVGQRLWLEWSCLMISPATKQTSRHKTRPLSACLFW